MYLCFYLNATLKFWNFPGMMIQISNRGHVVHIKEDIWKRVVQIDIMCFG